jgi:tRNA (guanine-N7-)-methyltransferase
MELPNSCSVFSSGLTEMALCPKSIKSSSTQVMTEDSTGTSDRSHAKPATKTKAHDLFQQPLSWPQISAQFAAERIELEIGSGKGLFLASAAQAQPNVLFVGIELAAKFADRAAQRLAKAELANAIMLRGDAKKFLESIPANALAQVHVYFPDPWWRNKHKKRRVLNDQTIADIQRVLEPGGQFHFWTDVLDYYEHICAELMDRTTLEGPHYVPQREASHQMDYTTHFERRARLNSQPVYRAIFIKPS